MANEEKKDLKVSELPAATAVSKTSVFVVDNGGATLEQADGQKVAAGLLGDLSGAAVEAMAALTATKKLWAEKLHNKGAEVSPTAPAVDLANATDALDVQGSRQYWVGDYVANPTTGVNAVLLHPVPNTNYVIEWGYGGGYAFHVYDMAGSDSFPSARVLTSEALSDIYISTVGVSTDGTKIGYLRNDKKTIGIISIDYDAWTMTTREITLPSQMTPYMRAPLWVSNDGQRAVVAGSNGNNLYGVNLQTPAVGNLALGLWPSWLSTDSLQFTADGFLLITREGQINEYTVNWDTFAWEKKRSYAMPFTPQMNYHYYAPADLFVGVINNTRDANKTYTLTTLFVYFLSAKQGHEIKLRSGSKSGTSNYYTPTDVYLRAESDSDVIRLYVGAAGCVRYNWRTKQVLSPTGPTGEVLGNCTLSDSTETANSVFVSDKGLVVDCECSFSTQNGGYIHTRKTAYVSKIIGEFLVRNGATTVLRAPLDTALLSSGALDPTETTLTLEAQV